jgi:hypothetical protein
VEGASETVCAEMSPWRLSADEHESPTVAAGSSLMVALIEEDVALADKRLI